jgi:hypothetical protein
VVYQDIQHRGVDVPRAVRADRASKTRFIIFRAA